MNSRKNPKKYKAFKIPPYEEQSEEASHVAGVFCYGVFLFGSEDLGNEIIGINDVGDCIGIIGWHPRVTITYHMKAVEDDLKLYFALLRLAFWAMVPMPQPLRDSVHESIMYLKLQAQKDLYDEQGDRGRYLKNMEKIKDIFKHGSEDMFKDVKFTLITTDPRQMDQLLNFLNEAGIKEHQIQIDVNRSQVFIERRTGKISNQCKNHPFDPLAISEEELENKEIPAEKLGTLNEDKQEAKNGYKNGKDKSQIGQGVNYSAGIALENRGFSNRELPENNHRLYKDKQKTISGSNQEMTTDDFDLEEFKELHGKDVNRGCFKFFKQTGFKDYTNLTKERVLSHSTQKTCWGENRSARILRQMKKISGH